MAIFTTTHAPLLQSAAQLFILPVSSEGTILDPVVTHCKTLYSDNYLLYRQHCRNGTLPVGKSLLYTRQRESSGLGTSGNRTQPRYLVNLASFDHPYHPLRKQWLKNSLEDVYPKLYALIRYEGLRRIALLVRPLVSCRPKQTVSSTENDRLSNSAQMDVPILEWQQDIYPIIQQRLQSLPKVNIDIHLPKSLAL